MELWECCWNQSSTTVCSWSSDPEGAAAASPRPENAWQAAAVARELEGLMAVRTRKPERESVVVL